MVSVIEKWTLFGLYSELYGLYGWVWVFVNPAVAGLDAGDIDAGTGKLGILGGTNPTRGPSCNNWALYWLGR